MLDPKIPPQIETQTEEEWEEEVLTKALGDALNTDGSVDFKKLRARGLALTLDELYPEGDGDDES
ncbi:MAG: hypothetical protein H7Y09_09050 [Chitinophagaceae bacterium]|nr:hypothetical protein [Anaerolineae bacterium]